MHDLAVEELASSLNQDTFNGYNITRSIAHVGNSTKEYVTIGCAGPHAVGSVCNDDGLALVTRSCPYRLPTVGSWRRVRDSRCDP